MTTPAAGLAGTTRSAARAPFHCVACGEPLFTRALACPHCGAPDPVAAEAPPTVDVPAPAADRLPPAVDLTPTELAPTELAPKVVPPPHAPVADLPATDLTPTELPATQAPATDVTASDVRAADLTATDLTATDPQATDLKATPDEPSIIDDAAMSVGPADDVHPVGGEPGEPAYAELEPVEAAATDPLMPRAPRPPTGSARLDIAPEPYEDDASNSRDLVLVPERGGRTIMLPEPRRRGRLGGVIIAGLVVLGLGAAGLFGWRMLAGPETVAAREVTVDTAWTPLDLDADAGPGEWVVTADAPFRIRVDGAVYTVGTPSGIAIPLDGREVSVRAISGAAKVTIARR